MGWDKLDRTHHIEQTDGSIVRHLVYDSARGVLVLFGGFYWNPDTGDIVLLGDTWEYDGVNWVQRSPASNPSARYYHAMAYDSARGVTVLFGGHDTRDRLNDTWEWDGTNWTQRFPATKPTTRRGPAWPTIVLGA